MSEGLSLAQDRLYLPFQKVDDEQHLVYGYASSAKRDTQGEIVTLDALEQALPSYMRWGNIREMHANSAVGVAREAEVDKNGLWVGAHIVDDRAWQKVKANVYKGFSIGGRATARDPNDRSIVTGLDLREISLVDRPANPDSVFSIIKFADGVPEFQPVQCWDCTTPGHQHFSKADAQACMLRMAHLDADTIAFVGSLTKLAEQPLSQLDAAGRDKVRRAIAGARALAGQSRLILSKTARTPIGVLPDINDLRARQLNIEKLRAHAAGLEKAASACERKLGQAP